MSRVELAAEEHPAVSALRAFFEEMYKWEESADEYLSSPYVEDLEWEELRKTRKKWWERMQAIYVSRCDAGTATKRLKDQVLSYGTPRRYDPHHEFIDSVEIKGEKVRIETHRDDHGNDYRLRYELVLKDGRWLVKDNKKHFSPVQQKWEARLL